MPENILFVIREVLDVFENKYFENQLP